MKFGKLLGLLALGMTLWPADPVVGTWKLNAAKSMYTPGPTPRSGTITYEETADGIKRTGELLTPMARPAHLRTRPSTMARIIR